MLRLGLLAILTAKLLLNMTKNTITTEQLFEMIQNNSTHVSAFEDKDFYQKFKSVTKTYEIREIWLGGGRWGEVYLSESFIQALREHKVELYQGDTNLP